MSTILGHPWPQVIVSLTLILPGEGLRFVGHLFAVDKLFSPGRGR